MFKISSFSKNQSFSVYCHRSEIDIHGTGFIFVMYGVEHIYFVLLCNVQHYGSSSITMQMGGVSCKEGRMVLVRLKGALDGTAV